MPYGPGQFDPSMSADMQHGVHNLNQGMNRILQEINANEAHRQYQMEAN